MKHLEGDGWSDWRRIFHCAIEHKGCDDFGQQVQSEHKKMFPHLTPNYVVPLSASLETFVS